MSDLLDDNMFYSRYITENDGQRRTRLRKILNTEIARCEWRNAWITLSWLTTELSHISKVRLSKTDAALITLEGDGEDTKEFRVNWKEVICV